MDFPSVAGGRRWIDPTIGSLSLQAEDCRRPFRFLLTEDTLSLTSAPIRVNSTRGILTLWLAMLQGTHYLDLKVEASKPRLSRDFRTHSMCRKSSPVPGRFNCGPRQVLLQYEAHWTYFPAGLCPAGKYPWVLCLAGLYRQPFGKVGSLFRTCLSSAFQLDEEPTITYVNTTINTNPTFISYISFIRWAIHLLAKIVPNGQYFSLY